MGVVYLGVAWDGAPVAVKVLRPDLADDEEFRRRFGREVSALVQVKGECTVRVIEADSQSATPFVVTEYAPGPSLSEYMDNHGAVGGGMLFGLATGLAEALTVIHAAGIMHRDLKPSNIILTDAGPKVIDFGIARKQQDTSAVTKAGMMIGSMGFMAPEQITGNPGSGCLRLGRDGGVRGHRPVAVRLRQHPLHPLPDHVRRRGHRHGP
jgi:serine/threonine protein kinase